MAMIEMSGLQDCRTAAEVIATYRRVRANLGSLSGVRDSGIDLSFKRVHGRRGNDRDPKFARLKTPRSGVPRKLWPRTIIAPELTFVFDVTKREPAQIKVLAIQIAVIDYYRSKDCNITIRDLLSERRTQNVVWPRQIAMYVCKLLTRHSLPELGRRFGGRDHTTVLHAVNKIAGLIVADPDSRAAIDVAAVLSILRARGYRVDDPV